MAIMKTTEDTLVTVSPRPECNTILVGMEIRPSVAIRSLAYFDTESLIGKRVSIKSKPLLHKQINKARENLGLPPKIFQESTGSIQVICGNLVGIQTDKPVIHGHGPEGCGLWCYVEEIEL